MKNKTSKIFVAFSMFGLLLTGCSNLLPNQQSRKSNSVQDSQVEDEFTVKTREIYNLYLAQGGSLTYEEWLESIRGADGKDGQTPRIGTNGNWWIGNTDTGVKAAGQDGKNGSNGADGKNGKDGADGKDGKDGADGKDGQTPYIGENGHWWIGTTDTGVAAKGDKGDQGVSITSTVINSEGELIITFSDGSQVNAGKLTFTEHVHEYTSEIVNPTCTTDGSVTLTCKTCGHTEVIINKAQGHIFEAWRDSVTPTCYNEGVKIRCCTVCGEKETETLPMHDHKVSTGYLHNSVKHWHYCETCGVVLNEVNHSFANGVCSICGCVQRDESVASGLIYSLNSDGESYTLADYGSCKDKDVVVPEMYNGKPVTAIGNGAFNGTDITSLVMSDNITSIGGACFKECAELTSVTLSKNIQRIESQTFMSCSSLAGIDIPYGVTFIGYEAFKYCHSLTILVFPNTVEEIEYWAALECRNLRRVVLSSGLRSLGQGAFIWCRQLKEVIIPEGCESISMECFRSTAIESIVIPSSLKAIDGSAFDECDSLTSAVFVDPENWFLNDVDPVAKELLENEEVAARKLRNSNGYWRHHTAEESNP